MYKLLFILLVTLSTCAHATDRKPPVVNNTFNTYSQYVSEGAIALAMASAGINFDWNTNDLQIAPAYGNASGAEAMILGAAYRPCKDCPLFTITASQTETVNGTENAFGFATTFRIKL